jgi:DNA processing protein
VDDNQQACLGFSFYSGIGPMTFIKLVAHFGSPHSAFIATAAELRPFFRIPKYLEAFISFRKTFHPEKELLSMHNQGIWIMTQWHSDYPKLLKNINDPPICLFGKGDRNSINLNNETCVGIVGARKNTLYGQYVAEELGKVCATAGLVIVSGMASGIDTISHKAAIEKQARTIAVLGTAIDIIYPSENKALHDQILNEYGIIISEYYPGFQTNRGMFVLRNRIVVGLSKAIIVVEGGKHSGTLTTARYAAENGRDVYAVPGPITSEMSVGPHILLREGARILSNTSELLNDFGLNHESETIIKKPIDLIGEEKKIYELLSIKKYFADEVAKKIDLSVSETLPILSLLEVRGVIGKDLDGSFIARV